MTRFPRLLALASMAMVLVSVSCSRNERSEQVSEDPYPDTTYTGGDPRVATGGLTADQTLPRTPPPDQVDTGTVAHKVEPVGGSRSEMRGQLRSEASRLDGAVKSGQFAAAVTSATRLRDLAVSIGGKTAGLPRDNILQVEHDVTAITEITENLRLQANARNHDGIKVQNDLLQPIVARILRLSA